MHTPHECYPWYYQGLQYVWFQVSFWFNKVVTCSLVISYGVFFSTKLCAFYLKKKVQFCVCFLKMFRPLKRWYLCFILNNSHLSVVEGLIFFALHKSGVLIRLCKADDSCLFIGLPDEIYKRAPGIVIQFWSSFFSLFCGVTLRKNYIIEVTWSVI